MNDPKTRNEIEQIMSELDATPTTVEPFEPGILRPGDRIYFLSPITLLVRATASGVGGGVMVERGSTVTITQAILDLNKDREGKSFLALIDDEEAQVAKFGRKVVGRGPWPSDVPVIEPGTQEARWALQRALEAAKHLPTPEQAREARQKAYEAYGKPDGSTSLGSFYGGGAR